MLNVLRDTREPLPLRSVAEAMQLPRPTVRQLLHSLVRHDWVEQDPVREPTLSGFGLLPYGERLRSADLLNITTSVGTALRDLCGETVTIQVRSGSNRIVIQEVEGFIHYVVGWQ